MKLLMMIGAATPPGRLANAVRSIAAQLQKQWDEISIEVISLAETQIETCDGRPLADYGHHTRQFVDAVTEASAVLIASPVYRASFPGVLKNLLDILPVGALQSKPVAIVAMGASAHHYLAVDNHLRHVLAWFGALVAPTGVYLTESDFQQGQLASDSARMDLLALAETLVILANSVGNRSLEPAPRAAKFV